MTATEKLRSLLDERGVEYSGGYDITEWDVDGTHYLATEPLRLDGRVVLRRTCTPEQAIDATLGRGTCHAVFEVDAMSEDDRIGEFVCSECGETFGDGRDQRPNYCPNCGRRCVG